MGCFDVIRVLTEKNLDKEFLNKYKHLLKVGVRGFGYWIWKPYIIKKTLQEMNDGDQLLYLDAGCHLNHGGRKRLLEYFDEVSSSDLKVGGFQLSDCHNEKRWTKMDLLVKLGVNKNDRVLKTGQVEGGHVILEKGSQSDDFVKEWVNIAENEHYVDDSPSIETEYKDFQEHRHDQSIFSILCKIKGAVLFSADEVYPADGASWNLLCDYPIQDRRDTKLSLRAQLLNKIAKCKRKIVHLMTRFPGLK